MLTAQRMALSVERGCADGESRHDAGHAPVKEVRDHGGDTIHDLDDWRGDI